MEPDSKPPYVTWLVVAAVAGLLLVVVLLKSPGDPKDDFAAECPREFSADVCAATLAKAHAGCLYDAKPRRELSEEEYRANPGNGRIEIGPLDPDAYRACMKASAASHTASP